MQTNSKKQLSLTCLLGIYCLSCCILVFFRNYAFTLRTTVLMILISTIITIFEWFCTNSANRDRPMKMMISLTIIWNIYLLFQII